MDLFYLPNRSIMERVLADPSVEQARAVTMLDETLAALAAAEAAERLKEEMERDRDLADYLNAAPGDDGEAGGDAAPDQARLVKVVRAAAKDGAETAQQVMAALNGWGIEPADLRRLPVEQRVELLRRITDGDRIRKLATLVGRMRNLARARSRNRLRRRRDEVYGITTGSDLGHALPSELAQLRHPLLRLDFLRRYVEGQITQYHLRGRQEQGRGPVVVGLDASGSMRVSLSTDGSGASRIDWAAAVAAALADAAVRDRRRCHAFAFNAQVAWERDITTADRLGVLELASIDATGGTSYDAALTHAMDQIETDRTLEHADIVLVTDGECAVSGPVVDRLQTFRDRGVRVWVLMVCDRLAAETPTFPWADRVWQVNAAVADDVAAELFEEVA